MKTTQSILLVILLLLNLFGFYIAYYVKLEMVHEEMEKTLLFSPASLQVVALNYDEYKQVEWTTPGKECRINGTMYDVTKTETLPGAVRLYVRMDDDETLLDNDFTQNFQSNRELPGTPIKLLTSLIGQDFIVAKNKIIIAPVYTTATFKSQKFNSSLAEFIMEKISPPPGADTYPLLNHP